MIIYWRVFCFVLLWIQYTLSQEPFKILCYYSDWRLQWHTVYRLLPKNIDAKQCTHIFYAFAMPDINGGIVPVDFLENLTGGGSEEFIKLKENNPNLKLMLSMGGWEEGSVTFSKIVADPKKRKWFANYWNRFIRSINFDGLDMNWEWPGVREGSNSADKKNFAEFMKDIRSHFVEESMMSGRERLLLTVVLPSSLEVASKGFDIPAIMKEVDFMSLHTMDYHMPNEPLVDHPSPLYGVPLSYFNPKLTVDNTVNQYLKLKIPPKSMNLGIAFYGRTYTLENPNHSRLGSRADDEGVAGYATKTPGLLSYYEICRHIKKDGWKAERPNSTAMGSIAYRDKNWVGYDDPEIIRKKVKYAIDKGLGGVALWTLDLDDYNGTCNERFPLTRIAREISISSSDGPNIIEITTPRDRKTTRPSPNFIPMMTTMYKTQTSISYPATNKITRGTSYSFPSNEISTLPINLKSETTTNKPSNIEYNFITNGSFIHRTVNMYFNKH